MEKNMNAFPRASLPFVLPSRALCCRFRAADDDAEEHSFTFDDALACYCCINLLALVIPSLIIANLGARNFLLALSSALFG